METLQQINVILVYYLLFSFVVLVVSVATTFGITFYDDILSDPNNSIISERLYKVIIFMERIIHGILFTWAIECVYFIIYAILYI